MTKNKMSLSAILKQWWDGEYVMAENQPGSGFVIFGGSYRRHWTGRAARAIIGFFITNWAVILGLAIGAIGLLI